MAAPPPRARDDEETPPGPTTRPGASEHHGAEGDGAAEARASPSLSGQAAGPVGSVTVGPPPGNTAQRLLGAGSRSQRCKTLLAEVAGIDAADI